MSDVQRILEWKCMKCNEPFYTPIDKRAVTRFCPYCINGEIKNTTRNDNQEEGKS